MLLKDRTHCNCWLLSIIVAVKCDAIIVDALHLAVQLGIYSSQQLVEMIRHFQHVIENSFDEAVEEPKITSRDDLIASNSRPLVKTHRDGKVLITVRYPWDTTLSPTSAGTGTAERPEVMRKHMTRVYDEILTREKDTVYIGEDVEHGG